MPHALIIGATGAIGGALAAALSDRFELTLVGRDAGALGQRKRALSAARAIAADVSVELDLAALADDVTPIDLLVYAVGVARPEPLSAADRDAWDEQWRVNALGFALTLKHLGARLAQGARVVVIGAQPELAAARSMAGYAASKAALDAIARVAALELRRQRTTVTMVRPPAVASRLWEPLGGAPKGALDAQVVARAVAASLAEPATAELRIDANGAATTG